MKKNHATFETLEIWKSFLIENKKIYQLIVTSKSCDWDLISQTRRAMISVGLNIAEGYSRYHNKEKEQFLNISIASLQEVKACIIIIKSLEPANIDRKQLQIVSENLEILRRQIISFKMHIRSKNIL
jgi:four helix bundle protein